MAQAHVAGLGEQKCRLINPCGSVVWCLVQQNVTAAAAERASSSHPSTWQVITRWKINLKEITQTEKSNLH